MCEEEDIEMSTAAPSITETDHSPDEDHVMTNNMVSSYPNLSHTPDTSIETREDIVQGAVKHHQIRDRKCGDNGK